MKFSSNKFLNLVFFFLVVTNLGMAVSYPILWWVAGQQGLLWRADFSAYYTAITMLQNGQGSQLYDLDLQQTVQQALLSPNVFKDGLLPFNYPPYVALVLFPLKALPLEQAYMAFALVQLVLLFAALRIFLYLSNDWAPYEKIGLILVVLAHPSLFLTLLLGSFTLVVFYSLVQFYAYLVRPHRLSGGIWLLPATFKLQNVIVPGLILIGSRNKRAILEVLVSGLILALVTSFVLGWNIWTDYARLIIQISGLYDQYGIVAPDMYNLKGALALILGEAAFPTINLINYLVFFVASILILFIFGNQPKFRGPSFSLKFSFAILLGLILSPHHNPQDSLLLILPLFFFYDHVRDHANRRRLLTLILFSIAPFQLLIDIILKGRLPFHWPFIVMLGMSFWIGWELLINFRNAQTEPI